MMIRRAQGLCQALQQDLNKSLERNESWYLLSSSWLNTWKSLIHYDEARVELVQDNVNVPPIDNSSIIDSTILPISSYTPPVVPTEGTVIEYTQHQFVDFNQLIENTTKSSTSTHVYSIALKPGLIENQDFIFVSKETWDLFVTAYGCINNRQTIERKVIVDGGTTTQQIKRIELYPYQLHLLKINPQTFTPDISSDTILLLSKKSRVSDLKLFGYYALNLLNVFEESKKMKQAIESDLVSTIQNNIRLWNYLSTNATLMDSSKMNLSLEDALLVTDQRIIVELPFNDVWPLDRIYQNQKQQKQPQPEDQMSTGSDEEEETTTKKKRKLGGAFSLNFEYLKTKITGSSPSPRSTTPKSNRKRGICGLKNLGNTCFMNSALQCLSNTEPLCDFFLSGKYVNDINKVNPLGSKGKLAKEFASLMKEMWSGSSCVAPINFKHAIGQFAPQFSGFSQHDSQELIAYLLDGLHEDLNKVKDKPLVALQEANGRPDELVAAEAWTHHLMRNRSVIVDLFQGQLKSTLKCPDCQRISIKFDPFMFLSVPIPHTSTTVMNVIFVTDITQRPKKYCIEISVNNHVGVLRQKFGDEFNMDSKRIMFADMIGYKVNSVLEDARQMSAIAQKKQILGFYVPEQKMNEEKKITEVRLTQRYIDLNDSQKKPCSIPLLLFMETVTTKRKMYEYIWSHVQRYTQTYVELQQQHQQQQQQQQPQQDQQSAATKFNIRLPFDAENRLFNLHLMNEPAYACGNDACADAAKCDGCLIECNDDEYIIPELKTLVVEWNNGNDFNSKEAMTVNLDPSVNTCKERISRQITLEDCLNTFSEMEQLGPNDPWYCPNCKDLKQAYKKFEIWSAPEIMCIHLKRFVYDRRYRERIDKFVDFPIERLDLSRFMVRQSAEPLLYDLYAISNHMGTLGGGHYVAHAKNNGQWYCFNDSSCSLVGESSLKTSSAYLLFYKRRHHSTDISVNLEMVVPNGTTHDHHHMNGNGTSNNNNMDQSN